MSTHHEPTYSDAIAVIAGLERMIQDLVDLRDEAIAVNWRPLLQDLDVISRSVREAAGDLRQDLRWCSGHVSAVSLESMDTLRSRLADLAADVDDLWATESQEAVHRQLAWLAGDVERMRAALAREEPPHGS